VTYPVHLVRNVAKHDGGAHIATVEDALATNTVVLVRWVTRIGVDRPSICGRTKVDEATQIINTRLSATRGVGGVGTGPRNCNDSDPLEGLLDKS
jgi:hypothetical protein